MGTTADDFGTFLILEGPATGAGAGSVALVVLGAGVKFFPGTVDLALTGSTAFFPLACRLLSNFSNVLSFLISAQF